MKNTLSTTHAQDLALTRSLVTTLIQALEKDIITPSLHEQDKCELAQPPYSKTLLWGEKENAVGALVKLTGLLLKVIPLEQQLAGNPLITTEDAMAPEDEAIVERYIKRVTAENKSRI